MYAPAVHGLGLATFLGWMIAGASWQMALTYAIAVLIITCPCALALAVPAVQIAAASRLFRKGIMVKAADGLERIAEADMVVFDKTGTLTIGKPQLLDAETIPTRSSHLLPGLPQRAVIHTRVRSSPRQSGGSARSRRLAELKRLRARVSSGALAMTLNASARPRGAGSKPAERGAKSGIGGPMTRRSASASPIGYGATPARWSPL